MEILVLSHEYPPVGGGGANACFFLSREFARAGHRVTIVTARYRDLPRKETTADGVVVHRVRCWRRERERSSFPEMLSFLAGAWAFCDRLQGTEHFDRCVVFFGIPSGPLALHLKHRYGLHYVVRFGGGDIPGTQQRFKYLYMVLKPVLRKIWEEADALIANSGGLKMRALEFEDQYPVTVIENGVDVKYFTPERKIADTGSCVNILFVSRLIERKGLHFLIPHLRKIESEVMEKCGRSIELVVVGDGPYRNVLENLVHETGAQNLVRFMGGKNKNELRKYYQQADIFVFPSMWEGMPNVVLEAMACGLPIVMTPCEGSRELVTDNGIITTVEDLSDNLVKLCTDSRLRASMGRNSIRNVERDFRWESIGERYLEILKREP